jgi:uronate dehydrogenase
MGCDLADAQAAREVTQGVDKIVHFAGYPREAGWETLIPANVIAVTNLWEAALSQGVQRIVYASTNHVVGFHPTSSKIGVDAELKCDSRYGVTKAFTETVARFYYEKFGIESLGLRIGRVEDAPFDARMLSTWLHPEDLMQQVLLGLTQPVRADILYGISGNSKAWCTNPTTGPLAGYQPRHRADDYSVDTAAATPYHYQGGPFATQDYRGDEARAGAFTLRQH